MRIVYLNSDSPYIIGQQGETNAVTLRVDVTEWVTDFPNGTGVILFTRPNKVVYPLETSTTTQDGKTYLQTIVTTKENNVPGWVVLQAQWYNGETLVKSMMFSGKVLVSGDTPIDPTETVPDWVTEWMTTLQAAIDGAGNLIEAAEIINEDYENILQSVSNAEAWAKGTRSGEAVEPTDETYHNNSKYYSEQIAATYEDVEAWANGTRDGVDIDSDDPAYQKNGKYYNTQAAASASAAAASASEAMTDTPEGYANVVASISPTYDGTATYAVGAYCLNGGKLYRCTTAITEAEATFNSAHWTQVNVGSEVVDIKSAFGIESNQSRLGYTVLFPEMEPGMLNNSGEDQTGTNSKRTIGYHEIIDGATYIPIFQNAAYGIKLIVYDASYTYKARKFPTAPFVMSEVSTGSKYYRYAVTTTDTTNYPVSNTSAAFELETTVITDTTLTKQGKAADAKAVGDALSSVITDTPNLIDLSNLTNGYLAQGEVVEDSDYRTSDYLLIAESGNYVKHIDTQGQGSTAKPSIWIYNSSKEYVERLTGESLSNVLPGWYSFTISSSYVGGYARLSTYNRNLESFFFGKADGILRAIPPYGKEINPDVIVNKSQILNDNYEYDSPLTGKVWYVIGDSASHGDFSGITQETIKTGIYTGELPVYSFLIGNRTGMVVHNLAVNGAVMATITSQPSRYQWSADDHYKLVGNDADYITIWLGANDMWQHVPVGTIDSTDVTTFYGAYNTVLSYYVANFPKTKLGIVASFWCTQEYAEAVIALGSKYGVPVLNLYNDPSRPVTVGSQRPDVADSIKTQRNAQWVVSETNSHPSAAYHEIESYFIEDWLKTL